MTLDSEKLLNLLAYAKERHGAPCRVEITAQKWYLGYFVADIFYRDVPTYETARLYEPLERILI